METSLELVESMFRILRARGMEAPATENRHNYGPVEDALGVSLPADFKAIMQAAPDLVSWGIGDLSFMTPEKMLKYRDVLQKGYPNSQLSLDWSKDKSFVVFGRNSSAFYYGYIKESGALTKIVRLDGEGSFEYSEEMACDLNLGELLYRMVVRAVTPEIWEKYGTNIMAYEFWHSASEAENMGEGEDCAARDGSQDHAASQGGRIVVLGRPVVWVGRPNIDDDEEEDYPTASVFQGASEEDFLRLGIYGVTHPVDQEEEDRQNAINNAPKQVAAVDMTQAAIATVEDLGFDDNVASVVDAEFGAGVAKAALVRQRLAAGERFAAFIGEGGKLAIFDMQDEQLWWNQEANRMLEEDEKFTHLSIGGQQFGFALTSKSRLMRWNGLGEMELEWIELPTNLARITHIDSRHNEVAMALEDGRVLLVKGKKPEIMEIQSVATLSMGGQREILFLHKDGTVSQRDMQGNVTKISLPEKMISVLGEGAHKLFLSVKGSVYGTGEREALPIAVTPDRIAAFEASHKQFKEQLCVYEEKLEAFSKLMTEHCEKCPIAIEQRAKKPRREMFIPESMKNDAWQLIQFKIQCATAVDGIQHTPEICGAPAKPPDLDVSNLAVPLASETTFAYTPGNREEVVEPTLLSVGPEHGRVKEISAPLTPKGSWNSVEGPYNFKPGSTAPVLAVGGGYGFSVFLHQDGVLSGCGDTGSLSLGINISVPEDEEEDEEEEEEEEAEEKADGEHTPIPIITQHSYSEKLGHIYIPSCGKIGMPAAASFPDETTHIIAFHTGHAGSLAVDQNGEIFGCGTSVGRSEPGPSYELLHVLQK